MTSSRWDGPLNNKGNIIIDIDGLDLTGSEEVARLEMRGYHLSDWAKSAFWSVGESSYDRSHILARKPYRLALVAGSEIKNDADRTNENMWKLGLGNGYKRPLAGVVPRLREILSDEEMLRMGFEYVIPAHQQIVDSQGGPVFLSIVSYFGGDLVFGNWGMPHVHWWGKGAWAFEVPL